MAEPLVKVVDLKKWFPIRRGLLDTLLSRKKLYVKAVDGVSFEICPKEIFGLAGESGCGKTTTGRCILRLIEPTGGKIFFERKDITSLSSRELKPLRRYIQIIFQDPYESLNPRMTIYDILAEPLRVQRIVEDPSEEEELVHNALEEVELTPPSEFFYRYPHELSGGQRQRVAIARAFILKPKFIVADEPVSMLDVSIRSEILKIMLRERERYETAILFITHDLSLARHMCEKIAIMYLGKIVELGETEKVIQEPLHPYTQALIAAVPIPDPTYKRGKIPIKGEVPNPINLPSGCRFHPRCPHAMKICSEEGPQLIDVDGRLVSCHLYK
ncbi:MAG: ABC transporter ATP-binding protein [archaeon GB-1867-005]|nr:ABC transporter ATP-binding protein [Candidatus Culexmicrobium cathedralense]